MCKVRCYVFRNSRFSSTQVFNKYRKNLHTTPHNFRGVQRDYENGQGKWHIKEITPRYPEEYLWREKSCRDELTVFINIVSHIAGFGKGKD